MEEEVALRAEDVKRIGDYVKPWLREVVEQVTAPRSTVAGIDQLLLERMVRVEEELKAQREVMEVRFAAVDQRFDNQLAFSERRFATVDRRFDDQLAYSERRFATVDQRFDDIQESIKRTQWLIGLGFVFLTAAVTIFGLLS